MAGLTPLLSPSSNRRRRQQFSREHRDYSEVPIAFSGMRADQESLIEVARRRTGPAAAAPRVIRESPAYQPSMAPSRGIGHYRRLVEILPDSQDAYFTEARGPASYLSEAVKWNTTGGGISPPRHRRLNHPTPKTPFHNVISSGLYQQVDRSQEGSTASWVPERLPSRDVPPPPYQRQVVAPSIYPPNGISRDIPTRLVRHHRPAVDQRLPREPIPPGFHSREHRVEGTYGMRINRLADQIQMDEVSENSRGMHPYSGVNSTDALSDPIELLSQRRNIYQKPRNAEAPRFVQNPPRPPPPESMASTDSFHRYAPQKFGHSGGMVNDSRPTSFVFCDPSDMTRERRISRPMSPGHPSPHPAPRLSDDIERQRRPSTLYRSQRRHEDEMDSGRRMAATSPSRKSKKWQSHFDTFERSDEEDISSDSVSRRRRRLLRKRRPTKIRGMTPTEILLEIGKLQNKFFQSTRPNHRPRSNSWSHQGFDVFRDRILPDIYRQTQRLSMSRFWRPHPFHSYPMPMPGYHPAWYAYPPPATGPIPYPYLPPPMWPTHDHPSATIPSWVAAGWAQGRESAEPTRPNTSTGMYPVHGKVLSSEPLIFVGPTRHATGGAPDPYQRPDAVGRQTTAEWDKQATPPTSARRRIDTPTESSHAGKASTPLTTPKLATIKLPTQPMSIPQNKLTKAGSNSADVKVALQSIKESNKNNLLLARNRHVAQMLTAGFHMEKPQRKTDGEKLSIGDLEAAKRKLQKLNPGVAATPEQLLAALEAHLNSQVVDLGSMDCHEKSDTQLIDPGFQDVIHEHTHSLRIDVTGEDERPASREIQVILIYRDPKVFVLSQFLTEMECLHIISLCEGRWEKSRTSKGGVDAAQESYVGGTSPNRTSSSARLPKGLTPLLDRVERRVAVAANASPDKLECLVVNRYETGQHFRDHHDGAFRPTTILVYLNDVDEGGETDFINLGFQVRPQAGTAVQWSNVKPNGEADLRLTHAALPPISGLKYVVNCFINSQPQCIQEKVDEPPTRPRSTTFLLGSKKKQ